MPDLLLYLLLRHPHEQLSHTLHMQQQPTSHSHALARTSYAHTDRTTTEPVIMEIMFKALEWTCHTVRENVATLKRSVADPSWAWDAFFPERRGAIDPTDHAYGFFDHLRACESVPDDVQPYFEAMNFFLREGFQEHSLVARVVMKWNVERQYSAYCAATAFKEPEFVRLLALYNPSVWTADNLADILNALQAEESRMSRMRLLEMSNLFFNHVSDVACGNDRLIDEDEEHTFDPVNDGVYFAVVNFFFEKGLRDEPLVDHLFQQWNVQEKYYQHCVETGFWLHMVTKDSSKDSSKDSFEDDLDVVYEMFMGHLHAIVKGKRGKDTFDTRRYIELLVHFERWAPTMSHGMTHEQKAKDCVYQFYTSLIKGVKEQWGIQHEYDAVCVVSGVLMNLLLTSGVDPTQTFEQFAAHLNAIVENQHRCPRADEREEYFRVLFRFQEGAKNANARLERDTLVGRFLRRIDATREYQAFATEQRGPPRIRRKGLVEN